MAMPVMRLLPRLAHAIGAQRVGRALEKSAARRRDIHELRDLRELVDGSGDLLCRLTLDGRIDFASAACRSLLGVPPEAAIGKRPADLVHPEHGEQVRLDLERLARGEVEETAHAVRIGRPDGRPIWVEAHLRLHRHADGRPRCIISVVRDVTRQKMLEAELETLALRDGLTGLANRRAFDHALRAEWRRSLREGLALSLLMMDVDHFKPFNDLYGHQHGDDCLRRISRAVSQNLARPGDVAARYGGEEIAAILPGTDAHGALRVAERIRVAIDQLGLAHHARPDGLQVVTLSIGAATLPPHRNGPDLGPEHLLAAADAALYAAKHAGRNQVRHAQPALA